mmetsp:Transcript_47155/g.112000  ORF Transcript_47155/g.112000 Transcript_47155/m.112000 type:complete len:282 (+) Transcript_47155:582-1427(+)
MLPDTFHRTKQRTRRGKDQRQERGGLLPTNAEDAATAHQDHREGCQEIQSPPLLDQLEHKREHRSAGGDHGNEGYTSVEHGRVVRQKRGAANDRDGQHHPGLFQTGLLEEERHERGAEHVHRSDRVRIAEACVHGGLDEHLHEGQAGEVDDHRAESFFALLQADGTDSDEDHNDEDVDRHPVILLRLSRLRSRAWQWRAALGQLMPGWKQVRLLDYDEASSRCLRPNAQAGPLGVVTQQLLHGRLTSHRPVTMRPGQLQQAGCSDILGTVGFPKGHHRWQQ